MSICEKPARQIKRPFNKNRPAEPYLNKKIFLLYSILLLIACHSLFQVNEQSSIFKSGWINYNSKVIYGLNHTRATLLPATISIGSTWNTKLITGRSYSWQSSQGVGIRLKKNFIIKE